MKVLVLWPQRLAAAAPAAGCGAQGFSVDSLSLSLSLLKVSFHFLRLRYLFLKNIYLFLFVCVWSQLAHAGSLVVAHGLSSCDGQAQWFGRMGQHVGSQFSDQGLNPSPANS